MSDSDERRRILEMLAAGQINVDQAAELLRALGAPEQRSGAAPGPRGPAKAIRVEVQSLKGDSPGHRNIAFNVPIGLAKFASRMMPREARVEMERRGIDLGQLLAGIDNEVPEGPLVDIDVTDSDGSKAARITVRVV